MKNSNYSAARRRKWVTCAVAVLVVLALTCASVAVVLSLPSALLAVADNNGAIYSRMQGALANYSSAPEEITVEGSIEMNGATTESSVTVDSYTVKSGQFIRFVGKDGNAKLTFTKPLTVEAEARVIFDVETAIEGGMTVQGTVTVNHRMYNASAITVANADDPNAEVASQGLVVDGSLNNNASQNGTITVNAGATLATNASTETTVNENSPLDGNKFSNNDGGTLMLKAGADKSLGLTVNGSLVNNGSVVYDNTASAPSTSGNPAVSAKFVDASSTAISDIIADKAAVTNYVIYASQDVTVDVGSSVALSRAVNLLSFGKVTFKNSASNVSFTVSSNVSLGGGVSNGVAFTQGKNELIFDGGAVWTTDNVKPDYGNISDTTTIFYADDSNPYVYTNNGNAANRIRNGSSAFFRIDGSALSVYGGTKITNYEMSGGERTGGGVGVIGAGSTFNMYGGEISWCAVTGNTNNGTGAGIYTNGGTINIFGGAVTHNAATSVSSSGNGGSADGAGISIDATSDSKNPTSTGKMYLYNGEISYNHGAVCMQDCGADGGGIMVRYSEAYVYGGAIRGNFAGGSGGGICAWDAKIAMYDGTIDGNRAAYGGGIAAVADSNGIVDGWSDISVYGGTITNNEAFRNNSAFNTDRANTLKDSGYGGAICLGSDGQPTHSKLTLGNAVIFGNKAFYGGGLAVYTQSDKTYSNQLTMNGGLISGNAAYTLVGDGYYDTYEDPLASSGGGVFVKCTDTPSQSMLVLSGDASIDSSNSVSFAVAKIETSMAAPISVSGTLGGSGLGALVYLDKPDAWTNNVIISGGAPYLNKFVLDSSSHSFEASGNDIVIGSASGIARVVGTSNRTTLKQALENVPDGGTIEILQSATLTTGQLTVNKNVTIQPATGLDVTLIIAGKTAFNPSDNALFYVSKGGSLTFNSNGGRLTIDGNGTGRILEQDEGNVKDISLVYVNGGSFTMGEADGANSSVYLRNNITGSAGSAVTVSPEGGTFTMNGGVIEDNTSTHANGSAVFMGAGEFRWNGGSIADNLTSNQNTQANYGVYLSSSQSLLRINNTIELTNNVLYVGTSRIYAEENFASKDKIGILLADASALTVNSVVVHGKNANVNLFEAHNAAGVTLHPVNTVIDGYTNNIVIYKTTTYLLDSRSETNVSLSDGADLANLIAEFLKSDGVTQFKTRDHNRVLAITISSTGAIPALNASGASISDLYYRTGYTLMSWTDNGGISLNWNGALSYEAAPNGATLYPVWQANDYNLTFNGNAPAGASLNGEAITLPTIKYSDDQTVQLPANKHTLIGYAFAGWTDSAQGSAILFTNEATVTSDHLKNAFTASTATRGLFELTVYAKWLPLFADDGGVGTSAASPFVISAIDHLQHLKDTVNGTAVTLTYDLNGDGTTADTEIVTYYNVSSADGVSYAPNSYSGRYFKLGGNINIAEINIAEVDTYTGVVGSSSATPFSGILDGQFKSVTLDGEGLFGYIDGAQVNNLILEGTVSSAMSNVGALAGTSVDSRITVIGSNASVTSSAADAVVGGIVGSAAATEIRRVFNHGAVGGSVATAGGLVGSFGGDDNFIYNSYNTGSVTASAVAGGIAGIANGGTLIQYVFNGGNVSAGASGVIGAIAGSGQGVNLLSTYYNTDKTYSASPVKAVGNADVTGSTALPSSQMAVYKDEYFPHGMTLNTLWVCKTHSDTSPDGEKYFYYPQLKDFANYGEDVADNAVRNLSKLSTQLTVPDETGDKPLTPEPFKVTYKLDGGAFAFDGNGGDGYFTFKDAEDVKYYADNSDYYINVQFGIGATVPQPADPSKIGYTFLGWYSDAGFNVAYDFNSGVSAANIELFAKWEPTEYRIVYELNGGTPAPDQSQKLTAVSLNPDGSDSDRFQLDICQPEVFENVEYYGVRSGYFFTHWVYIYTSGGVQTSYEVDAIQLKITDGRPVVALWNNDAPLNVEIDLSSLQTNELRFVAQWQPRTYNITYKYIDSEGNPLDDVIDVTAVDNKNNPLTYTIEDSVSLAYATLTGYEAKGWRVLNGTEYVEVNGFDAGNYGDRTFYGVLDAISFRITFNTGAAGTLNVSGQTDGVFNLNPDDGYYYMSVPYGAKPSDYIKGELSVTIDSSDFKGWSSSRTDSTRTFDLTAPFVSARHVTVYAVYQVKTYNVTVSTENPDANEAWGTDEKRYFIVKDIDDLETEAAKRGDNGIVFTHGATTTINGQEVCTSYTIENIEHGRSAYYYLATPYSTTGKSFTGWSNLAQAVEVKDTTDVYAQFKPPVNVIFTNTFVEEEGDVKRVNPVDVEKVKTEYTKYQYEVKGYTFSYWADVAGKEVDVENTKFTTVTLLFAVYTPVDVTVNFVVDDPLGVDDGNHVEGLEKTSASIPYDQLFGSLPMLTRLGYTFNGWYAVNAKGERVLINANSNVRDYAVESKDAQDKSTFTVNLYANNADGADSWTEINYSIRLSAGIGIAATFDKDLTNPISYTYKQSLSGIKIPCVAGKTVTREGFTLKGWYYGDKLLTANTDGEVILEKIAENITLTAYWEQSVIDVTFDAGEGSFTVLADVSGKYYSDEACQNEVTQAGDPARFYKVGVLYGTNASVPALPEKYGHRFNVWNNSLSNITAEVTITASYVEQTYAFYLSANGGSFADGSALIADTRDFKAAINYKDLTLPNARTGYTFKGWDYELVDEKGVKHPGMLVSGGSIEMHAGALTLSAHWEVSTYTIKISGITDFANVEEFFTDALNGKGTVTVANNSDSTVTVTITNVEHGTDMSALNNRPTRTNADSKEEELVWKTGSENGSGDIYIFSTATSALTLHGEWVSASSDVVKVTFNYNDNGDSSTTQIYPYSKGATVVFPTPVRLGYTFMGWYYDGKLVTEFTIPTKDVTTLEFTANWDIEKYYITYVPNGGKDLSKTEYNINVFNNGGKITLSATTRTGYDFDGWFTDSACSNKFNPEEKRTGDVTLFAGWTIKSYQLNVSGYLGDASLPLPTVAFGGDYTAWKVLWSRNHYNVSVYLNDPANSANNVLFTITGSTLPALDEDNNVNGNKFFVYNETAKAYVANVTIVYAAIDYKVIYLDANGGIHDDTTQKYNVKVTDAISVLADSPAPAAGMTFKNWGIVVNGELCAVDSYQVEGTSVRFLKGGEEVWRQAIGAISFRPMFEITTYTIKLNANDGSAEPAVTEQTFTYNVPQPINRNTYVRAGYTFKGWALSKTATEAQYADERELTLTANLSDDNVLYAVWEANVYQVYFNLNGGTYGGSNVVPVTYGQSVTLIKPAKVGYDFTGWTHGDNKKWDNTVSSIELNTSNFTLPATGNLITLTAQWSAAKSYNIVYVLGDGGVNHTSNPSTYTVETDLVLQNPTRPNYTFAGWYTDSNYRNPFNYQQGVTVDELTLYARWTATEYTITLVYNDGVTPNGTITYTVENAGTTELPSPNRAGYTFDGWYNGETKVTDVTIALGSVTLTAKWSEATYKVTFNANGGTMTIDGKEETSVTYNVTFNGKYTLPVAPARTGYDFAGWYTEPASGDKIEDGGTVTIAETHTLYAHWTAKKYTVLFTKDNSNEPFELPADTVLSYDGVQSVALTSYKADGYVFNGWTLSTDTADNKTVYTGTVYLADVIGFAYDVKDGDVTNHYIAFVTSAAPIPYSITYVLDGGSFTGYTDPAKAPDSFTVNDTVTLPTAANLTKTGYDFAGWYLTETAQAGEQAVTEITNKHENVTLYAKWTANSIQVTLNHNDKTDGTEPTTSTYTVTYDAPYGQLPAPAERLGYTFDGYFTAKEGGTKVTSDQIVSNDQMHVLYAHWTATEYTITYLPNGGTFANGLDLTDGVYKVTYTVENRATRAILLTDTQISRQNYVLAGWSLNNSIIEQDDLDGMLADVTLVAQWTATEYEITLNYNYDGAPADEKVAYTAETTSLSLPNPVRANYTFDGWYTDAACTDGNEFAYTFDGVNGQITQVYAKWTAVTYRITLNNNGEVQVVEYSAENKLQLPTLTREGYTFGEWYTDKACTNKFTYEESKIASYNGTIVYAKWTAIEYPITINAGADAKFVNLPEGYAVNADGAVVINKDYDVDLYLALQTLRGCLQHTKASDGYNFFAWNVNGSAMTEFKVDGAMTITADWRINTVSVTLIRNDGKTEFVAHTKDEVYTAPDLSGKAPLTGYQGWEWQDYGTGDKYSDKPLAGSIVLREVPVQALSLEVTLNANGGSLADDVTNPFEATYGQPYGQLPELTRTGYTFNGWWLATATEGAIQWVSQVTAETLVSNTADHTLYARWTPNKYVVSFVLNGGSGTGTSSVSKDYGDDVTIALPALTKAGYNFAGWYLDAEFNGNRIDKVGENVLTEVSLSALIGDGRNVDVTLYARWSAIEYTVYVDGTATPLYTGNLDSTNRSIELLAPSQDGHRFNGWSLSNGGAVAIPTSSNVTVQLINLINVYNSSFGAPTGEVTEVTITLYSDFSANDYTVTLNPNGGSLGTNPATVTVTYGGNYVGKLPALERLGYTFDGWYDAQENGNKIITVVTAEDPVLTTVTTAGSHTLYAHWTPVTYNVTLNHNDKTDGTEPTKSTLENVTYNAPYGQLPTPVSTGYTFNGWWTDTEANGWGSQVTAQTVVSNDQAHTLYARWTVNTYVVSFDLGGGTSADAAAKPLDYTQPVTLPAVTRSGYDLEGWYLNGTKIAEATDLSVALTELIGSDSGSLLTLEAKWTARVYVLYVENTVYEIEIDGVKTSALTFDNAPEITLPVPQSDDGHRFLGWTNNADRKDAVISSGTAKVSLASLITYAVKDDANNCYVINLYVVNPANVYTVTLDANGGDPVVSFDVTFGQPYGGKLPAAPDYSRTGYTFDGWFTAITGGSKIETTTTVATAGSHTLYAHWTANTYAVSLGLGGGSLATGAENPFNVTYGQPYGELSTPTRVGYEFVGWFLGNTQITSTATVSTAGDHTLVAQWRAIDYTITYVLNGGTGAARDTFNAEKTSVTLQTDVARLGYTFAGWYDNEQFNGSPVTVVTYDASNLGDVTVYAKWTAVTYALEFYDSDGSRLTGNALLSSDVQYPETAQFDGSGICNIVLPAPSKDNLTYSGWNIAGNTSVTYTGTISLANIIPQEGTTIKLTVVWSDPVFVITYNVPADAANPNPRSCKRGASLTLQPAERPDYDFAGWLNASGETVTTFTPEGDTVLTAAWTPKAYVVTVTVVGWTYGGTQSTPAVTVTLNGESAVSTSKVVVEYAASGSDNWSLTAPVNAGDYKARAYYLFADGEHGGNSADTAFTIGKKSVTLTVKATGVYGDDLALNSDAKLNYDGLVNGDSASAITLNKVVLTLAQTSGYTVGTPYDLTVQIVEYTSDNYVVTAAATGSTYAFTKRDVTVTINTVTTSYKVAADLTNVANLVSAALAYDDDISALGITLSTSANADSPVGNGYVISGTFVSVNYNVRFINGVHTIVPLNVSLVMDEDIGGIYGGQIKAANITGVTSSVAGVTAQILAEVKAEILGKYSFVYTGASFDGETYDTPNVMPVNAGTYYAVAVGNAGDNYNVTGASRAFRIEKAQNVISGNVTINGWMYNATPNAPTGCSALNGDVIYTYSATANGPFTTTVPTSVGTYFVRAEAAENSNYKAAASSAVSFAITKAVLNAPKAVIVTEGDNRNVEYTGNDLRLAIDGFNSVLMLVSYDGQTIVDGNNVAVVARNAGAYVIKIALVDTDNYAWAAGVQTDADGNVVLGWTIARKKISVLKPDGTVLKVNGEYQYYIPAGFDESIMSIDGNREAFGGDYTAVITLKDSANYEWSEDVSEVKIEWRMDGIHKAFVIVVSVAGGLAAIGGGAIGVQYLWHARKKRLLDREIDQRSAADASDGGDKNDGKDDAQQNNDAQDGDGEQD